MKVSLSWLREFVELPASVAELIELLTLAGVEVEGVEHRGADIPKVVAARILESAQHPNADRLSVCKVDAGSGEPLQIVCGAKNYKPGDNVPLALPGAVLPGDFKIKVGKLRGVESQGMLCSARELGLGEGEDGLLILPPETRPGTPLAELFPADVVLDLEITPNRADLLSHFGIAREIAALRGVELKMPEAPAKIPAVIFGNVTVPARDLCQFYSARRIRGVKVAPSPAWLRRRLETVGIRSINNIVDVTNFVMMELGQPLHAFDEARLDSGHICVRRARETDKFVALDGKPYELGPDDLIIADSGVPVAIAGVMGGEHSGVTEGTTDVVIESALFAPAAVRRTSRRLGLASDSSYRFERGIDPAGILTASQRAVSLITEIAGGDAAPELEAAGVIPGEPRAVHLREGRASALLGVEVPAGRADEILTRFGLRKEDGAWLIPSWRPDLSREADLIEEITRAFGIENVLGAVRGQYVHASPADAAHDSQMEIRRRLVGHGFHEARSFSLISEAAAESPDALRIRNPLLEDQVVLRPSLLPGLVAALERNLRGGTRSVRLFELGRVFLPDDERVHLSAILTGPVELPSWRNSDPRAADLFDLKGILESLGFEGISFATAAREGFLPSMEIRAGNATAGVIGQLAPARLRALDLQQPVAAFEIDLGTIKLRGIPRKIVAIPKYPSVRRDIAIVVEKSIPHSRIEEVLADAGEPLLSCVELFDLFSDPAGIRVPTDQKSLAYSLTFRSPERTLTADEVNAAHARLKERLKAALPVSFRE